MRLFLSSLEFNCNTRSVVPELQRRGVRMLWNLMSYYYARKDEAAETAEKIRDGSELVLIDSGAHTMQKGARVDYDRYTEEYAEWIRGFDRPNVLGYFEMDVDNIIGYDAVLRLREKLMKRCGCPEKIIPVWHRNRGVEEFKAMCAERKGGIVAITGFRNDDVRDEQYPMFLKCAWQAGCELHCLGMSRSGIMDKVPFDYCDSSTWGHCVTYGRSLDGSKYKRCKSKDDYTAQFTDSYLKAMEVQQRYYLKWKDAKKGFEIPSP